MLAWPYPKVIAHRGAGKLAPENTLAAIRHGAHLGHRCFEFDVKLSGDGVLILMHDDTTDRTTDGRGRVAGKNWHQLAHLDAGLWHSKAYAGEGIPTFWRVAKYLLANDLLANVEIKPCPGRECETGAAVALDASLLWANSTYKPLLSSFSLKALVAASEAVPALPRGLLLDEYVPDWLHRVQAAQAQAVIFNWQLLDKNLVQQAKDQGLRVACYTCNDRAQAELLWAWGVDSVISDAVDVFADFIHAQ
jgi:glycerophosphoryl diester phosphodiesterase